MGGSSGSVMVLQGLTSDICLHQRPSEESRDAYERSGVVSRTPPSVRYPPLGLKNCGNTCYANAALQCLLSTTLARALIEPKCLRAFRECSPNGDLMETCESSSVGCSPRSESQLSMSDNCKWLTNELTVLCKQYTSNPQANAEKQRNFFSFNFGQKEEEVLDPGNITRNVSKLSSCLRIGRQEDAHEFIRALLETLVMNGKNKKLSCLFDGLLESAVTCQACGHCSLTRDRYMDLSLEINLPEVSDLVDALKMFTRTENLSEDNLVHCDRCDKRQMISKGLRLATAPTILTCHLKRFAYDPYGRMIRLRKKVKFTLKLDIGDFMSRANHGLPSSYELVAVLVHQGTSCSHGHYLAYVRSGDRWYRVNDTKVDQVSVDLVLAQEAYILMYEVEGMRNHKITRRANSFDDSLRTTALSSVDEEQFSIGRYHSFPSETNNPSPEFDCYDESVSMFDLIPLCEVINRCLGDLQYISNEQSIMDDQEERGNYEVNNHTDGEAPLLLNNSLHKKPHNKNTASNLEEKCAKSFKSKSDSKIKSDSKSNSKSYHTPRRKPPPFSPPEDKYIPNHRSSPKPRIRNECIGRSASSGQMRERMDEATIAYDTPRSRDAKLPRTHPAPPNLTGSRSLMNENQIVEGRCSSSPHPQRSRDGTLIRTHPTSPDRSHISVTNDGEENATPSSPQMIRLKSNRWKIKKGLSRSRSKSICSPK